MGTIYFNKILKKRESLLIVWPFKSWIIRLNIDIKFNLIPVYFLQKKVLNNDYFYPKMFCRIIIFYQHNFSKRIFYCIS